MKHTKITKLVITSLTGLAMGGALIAPQVLPQQQNVNASQVRRHHHARRHGLRKIHARKNGLRKIHGRKYYFVRGRKLKGFRTIRVHGHKYRVYFSKKSGAMLTGFRKIHGRTYYFSKKTGNMLRGRHRIGKRVYIFAHSGRLMRSYKLNLTKKKVAVNNNTKPGKKTTVSNSNIPAKNPTTSNNNTPAKKPVTSNNNTPAKNPTTNNSNTPAKNPATNNNNNNSKQNQQTNNNNQPAQNNKAAQNNDNNQPAQNNNSAQNNDNNNAAQKQTDNNDAQQNNAGQNQTDDNNTATKDKVIITDPNADFQEIQKETSDADGVRSDELPSEFHGMPLPYFEDPDYRIKNGYVYDGSQYDCYYYDGTFWYGKKNDGPVIFPVSEDKGIITFSNGVRATEDYAEGVDQDTLRNDSKNIIYTGDDF